MRYPIPAIALLAGFFISACSQRSQSPMTATPPAIIVTPADGATGVRLDAEVTLTFASPMNQDVVERDVHLISDRAMTDPNCPDSTVMNHGSMEDWMADGTMMNHTNLYHSVPGRFSWNENNTMCVFQPDSMMTAVTVYMIHMGREMMNMIEARNGSGMASHGMGTMSGDMMLHFTTMDNGDGHAGHH